MTFEDAYRAAAELLERRGQLLNGHLLRLVERDKDLFRDVREALILNGLAEDRAGVGLAANAVAVGIDYQTESASSNRPAPSMMELDAVTGVEANPAESVSDESDWWLMVSGITRGPFEFETLRRMQQRGEIGPGDVVRCGTRGLWLQQSEVLRLARQVDSRTGIQGLSSPTLTVNSKSRELQAGGGILDSASRVFTRPEIEPDGVSLSETTGAPKPYVMPEKDWSMGARRRPSWLRQAWDTFANVCGGSRRLAQVLVTLTLISLFMYWWRQPPPSNVIYQEFADCSSLLRKLRERRIGRSEWAPTVNRWRPRVSSLVSRLQFRSSPAEKELYQAGSLGLLPLLEIPADPTTAERIFDKHMASARQYIDKMPSQGEAKGK